MHLVGGCSGGRVVVRTVEASLEGGSSEEKGQEAQGRGVIEAGSHGGEKVRFSSYHHQSNEGGWIGQSHRGFYVGHSSNYRSGDCCPHQSNTKIEVLRVPWIDEGDSLRGPVPVRSWHCPLLLLGDEVFWGRLGSRGSYLEPDPSRGGLLVCFPWVGGR